MSRPVASVIIPAYNAADDIERCLASVLESAVASDIHVEVIVVDDGSTDGTARRVPRGPDIAVVSQENAGPGAARNRGVRHARAERLLFLDSDDTMTSSALGDRLSLLSTMDMVMTSEIGGKIDGNRLLTIEDVAPGLANFRSPSGWAVWRELYDRVGGFDARLRVLEDVDFVIGALAVGGRVLMSRNETFHYDPPSGSRTGQLIDALLILAQKVDQPGGTWASELPLSYRRYLARRWANYGLNVASVHDGAAGVRRFLLAADGLPVGLAFRSATIAPNMYAKLMGIRHRRGAGG